MLKRTSIWLVMLGMLAVPMSSICAENAPAGAPGCCVNVCHVQEAPSDCCEIGESEAPVIPDAVKVSPHAIDPPAPGTLAAVNVEAPIAIARAERIESLHAPPPRSRIHLLSTLLI